MISKVTLRCRFIHPSKFRPIAINAQCISTQVPTIKHGALITRPVAESPSTPVVAILGWNDAKMKHIQKYSKIFEEKNWTTVCLPATSFDTFFRPSSKVKTTSMYMMDLLKQLTSGGNPVFLYSLSSGGCTVYYHIAKALTSQGSPHFDAFKVVGAIFDSCPVKNTKEGIHRLQISVTERVHNPIVKNLIWYAVSMTWPLVIKLDPLLGTGTLFDELESMILDYPELYFYSKADKLALYRDIDDFIIQRKSLGVTVLNKRWDDPPHVSHYMKYPEEYLELLEQFLNVCLPQENKN
ncbi:Hypothetical predicted protein [Paramuricea clavata]|uniref:Uncharacterized protein n=1 Tax=Paramuricea clavata TaxID=317549 RepID=A0A7D9IVJ5_PARCT|nr:Hypothetical predicted protein [Paramuricea clavata]